MKMKCIFTVIAFMACSNVASLYAKTTSDLSYIKSIFETPVTDSRPGVYWYFMDGNISKEGITKDLESMKKAGIGSVVFLEVNVGVPRGNVDLLSPEWKACFKHAVEECERLDISMVLGIGPGWNGSGGPWVKAEESMRHVVSSSTNVHGKGLQHIFLKKPLPKAPFFGKGSLTPEIEKKWMDYYEDVLVLAFPASKELEVLKDADDKALYYRAPYSSSPVAKQYVVREKSQSDASCNNVISRNEIHDITKYLKGDTLIWKVPEGDWTIMRFGLRNNGAVTRPAPFPGLGFESDKTDKVALHHHQDNFTNVLLSCLGQRDTTLTGGLKGLHIDSWEMGSQNWSPY